MGTTMGRTPYTARSLVEGCLGEVLVGLDARSQTSKWTLRWCWWCLGLRPWHADGRAAGLTWFAARQRVDGFSKTPPDRSNLA